MGIRVPLGIGVQASGLQYFEYGTPTWCCAGWGVIVLHGVFLLVLPVILNDGGGAAAHGTRRARDMLRVGQRWHRRLLDC